MTFEEWMKNNSYLLSYIDEDDAEFLIKEAWYYQQKRVDELEHKLALCETRVKYPKVVITDEKGNIRLQTDDFGNLSVGTVQESE
jgi:hypothetical protein